MYMDEVIFDYLQKGKHSIVHHLEGKITGNKCDPKLNNVNCKNQKEKR